MGYYRPKQRIKIQDHFSENEKELLRSKGLSNLTDDEIKGMYAKAALEFKYKTTSISKATLDRCSRDGWGLGPSREDKEVIITLYRGLVERERLTDYYENIRKKCGIK